MFGEFGKDSRTHQLIAIQYEIGSSIKGVHVIARTQSEAISAFTYEETASPKGSQ